MTNTTLHYKTCMQDDQDNITEHTMELDSYEHAEMIAYDLEHGDFGDLICFAIRIVEPA